MLPKTCCDAPQLPNSISAIAKDILLFQLTTASSRRLKWGFVSIQVALTSNILKQRSLWRIHQLVPAPSTVVLIGCPATIPILIGQEESNRVEKVLIRHMDTLVEAPFFYKWVLAQKTLLQQVAAGSIRYRVCCFLWCYGSWQPGHPLFWCSLACEATGQSWRLQQLCPENWDKFRHPERSRSWTSISLDSWARQ